MAQRRQYRPRILFCIIRNLGLNILILISCTGCLKTEISSPALDSNLRRLQAANHKTVRLKIVLSLESEKSTPIGHQYLAIFFPFGRIYLQNSKAFFEQQAITNLALLGFQTEIDSVEDSQNAPLVQLTISNFSLSAYDLLFARYLLAELAACVKYQKPNPVLLGSADSIFSREECVLSRQSEYNQYGFSQELSTLFYHTTNQALLELLSKALRVPLSTEIIVDHQ